MADLLQTDQQNKQNKSQAPTLATTPGTFSPQGGVASNGSSTQAPTIPSVTKQGTGFTNIQRIADASKGSNLGQQLQSNIQNQVINPAQQALQQGQTQTTTAQTAPTMNQNTINSYLANPGTADATTAAAVKGYLGQQYTGPEQLTNLGDLQAKQAQVQALGQLAGSQGGQQALLQQFARGNSPYTSGQQSLDLALLNQGATQPLSYLRQQAPIFSQALKGAESQAEQTGKQNQAQVQQNVSALQSGIQSKTSDILNQAQAAQTAANTTAQNQANTYKAFNDALSTTDANGQPKAPVYTAAINALRTGGLVTPKEATTLMSDMRKLSPAQLPAAIDSLKKQFSYTGATGGDSSANFISPQQAASLNALQSLTGINGSYTPGQYNQGSLGFNLPGMSTYLDNTFAPAKQVAPQSVAPVVGKEAYENGGGLYIPPNQVMKPSKPIGKEDV